MPSTTKKLTSRSLWPSLAAVSLVLGGCDPGGVGALTGDEDVVQITSALEAPSGVEVYAQLPFDVETGDFDLDAVDDVNSDPVLKQNLAIPYDEIEQAIRAGLAELTAQPFGGTVPGVLGSEVEWHVQISADARFSQRGQPRLSQWGDAASNGVDVEVDNQIEINLNAHVSIHPTAELIPNPTDLDVPIRALIGGHGRVHLTFSPTIRAEDLNIWATLDTTDIGIIGRDDQPIGAGAVISAGIAVVTGNPATEVFLSALTGDLGLDAANDMAKAELEKQAAKLIAGAHETLTAALNKALQPRIADASDLLARLRNQPMPGFELTLGQMEAQLGMTLDVRSTTSEGRFRTAFTARFANVPGRGWVYGVLHLPKRQCVYRKVDSNPIVATLLSPVAVVDANQQMRETGCAGVDAAQLIHDVYYGQNPDRVLKTGAPENNLVTWANMGTVTMEKMVETETSFNCPFMIYGLPDAAFIDIRPTDGSALARALSARQLAAGEEAHLDARLHGVEPMGEGRFVMLAQGPSAMFLDHTASVPVWIRIGAATPSEPSDCPSIELDSGTGLQPAFEDPQDRLDPTKCPECGVIPDGASIANPVVNPDPGATPDPSASVIYDDHAAPTIYGVDASYRNVAALQPAYNVGAAAKITAKFAR